MTRGRTMERGVGGAIPEGWSDEEPQASAGDQMRSRSWRSGSRIEGSRERGRGVLGRIIMEKEEKGSKDKIEGWKEFKKGHFLVWMSVCLINTHFFVFRNIYIPNFFQYPIECSSIYAV